MDRKKIGWSTPSSTKSKNVETPCDSNWVCKAMNDSGSVCRESQSLRIIDEIHQVYADRLQRIDDEAGGDELKIRTLLSWINELGEQNAMLVRTVEQLEQEAADRVALLEDSLQRSSRVAFDYMTKLQEYDKQMHDVTGDKVDLETNELKLSLQLELAKKNEEELHERVKNLQNDIASLLELIRQARHSGSWDLHGLNFKEVTPEDIFGTYPYQTLSEKDEFIRRLQDEIQELQNLHYRVKPECDRKDRSIADLQGEIKKLQDDVATKDSQIKGFVQRIQELRDSIAMKSDQTSSLLELATRYDLHTIMESEDLAEGRRFELEASMWNRRVVDSQAELIEARTELRHVEHDALQQQSEIMNVTHKLNESEQLLHAALHERNELAKEVNTLSAQLTAKTDEVMALTLALAESEKSAKDMREALTAEVAEKHDQLLALRRDVMQLEEQCRQADMQTHFKDDIIKEMRKDIKLARSKLAILEGVAKSHGSSGEIGKKLLALNELSYSLPMKSYEHQDRIPTSSLPYDLNTSYEKVAQVVPYQHVSDNAGVSHMHQCRIDKLHHAGDTSMPEKIQRHSHSLSHSLSHEKVVKTRTKGVRIHSQLNRVEEALKQELSKLNNQSSSKHVPYQEVEVVDSNTSTRTIAVQYSQHKQTRYGVDLSTVESKERHILQLEGSLKNLHKNMLKKWDEVCAPHKKTTPEHYSILKEEVDAMVKNLVLRDEKIARQNTMIEELESRLKDLRDEINQLHDRSEVYLRQMTAAQKSHDESQRRIAELKDTLDLARRSMSGSLSRVKASVDNKEMVKAMDSMQDYQHKADECEATLSAMKGEIDLLMHNMSSREKQVKTLEETINNLQSSLGSAKEDMEYAHKMAMSYVASLLPDDVDKISEMLHQDQATSQALIDAIKDLLNIIKCGAKMERPKTSPAIVKKNQVSFAGGSSEDQGKQIKDLQEQLKEAQNKILSLTPEDHNKPTQLATVLFAREIEEFRVRTVEAQAALEDLKDAMDSLHENLHSQESQVLDLEKMMMALLDTLLCAQKHMNTIQEKINPCVLGTDEQWINLQKSLNNAIQEIRNIWAKSQDYSKQKEELEMNRQCGEQKIEKLYLELESTQESLKNAVIELKDSICRD